MLNAVTDGHPVEGDNLEGSESTELYLGLVHGEDGVAGAQRRIASAQKLAGRLFRIASECGIARGHSPE
jgi:hypothetical protein